MNDLFSVRTTAQARSGAATGTGRRQAAQPESVACESYDPGHQMHYTQQGQALRSPSVRAEGVVVDGDRVVLQLSAGEQLEWRHHDPTQLRSILDLFPTSRVVYRGHHALRVGPYWFNCSPSELRPCPPALAVGSPASRPGS